MVATIPTPTTSEDIIMSSTDYNQTTKVVLAMPITTSNRYQNNKWCQGQFKNVGFRQKEM